MIMRPYLPPPVRRFASFIRAAILPLRRADQPAGLPHAHGYDRLRPFRARPPPPRAVGWGQPVDLQSRPFDILLFLVSERDRVVSRDDIMAHVWQGQVVAESNLTVQMSILRRTLADCGASGLIITVPGRGYRFVEDVAQVPDAPTAAPARRQLGPLRICVIAIILAGSAWRYGVARFTASPLTMRALVRVEVDPHIVTIMPDGVTPVNYLFTVENQVDLQLETEDIQFYLTTGAPVGAGNVGGRIWRGSFPIRGGHNRRLS